MPYKNTILPKTEIKKAKILLFCAENGRRPSTNRKEEYQMANDMRNYIKKTSTSYDEGFRLMIEKYPYVNGRFLGKETVMEELIDFINKKNRMPSSVKESVFYNRVNYWMKKDKNFRKKIKGLLNE